MVLELLELDVNGGIAPIGFGDLLPGVAETLNWTQALMTLDRLELDPETVNETLGTLLKYQDDIAKIQGLRGGEDPGRGQARARRRG